LSIDVIVVTYNSAAEVAPCLAAVRGSAHVERLIVVDNASSDGSVGAARRVGADLVLENERNVGFARAVNRGLEACAAEYMLLLNPDAVVTADTLSALVECLVKDEAVAMAGPLLVTPDGKVIVGGRRFSTAANRLLWHLPLPGRPLWSTPEYGAEFGGPTPRHPVPVDYLWGAALLCRSSFLREIGGLDERFFLYSEDEDLGRRARQLGLRSLLVPDATVRHVGGASSRDETLAQARIEMANTRLLAKWEGERAARAFRAGIGPVLALRALLLALVGRRDEARLPWRTCRLLRRARRSESVLAPADQDRTSREAQNADADAAS